MSVALVRLEMARLSLFLLLYLITLHLLAFIVQANNTRRKCAVADRRFRRDDLEVLGQQFNSRPIYEVHDTAAYFSGKEIIEFQVPMHNKKFTIELWINPEGGQPDDVPILNYYDRCRNNKTSNIWKLGVSDGAKGRDSRFYFSMKTYRVKERYRVIAHNGYRPGIWTHVAVVFNGTSLELFVNQAQVAVNHKAVSPVTAMHTKKCEVLEMGGDSHRGRFFRGTVDDLRIWKKAKSQRDIIADMFHRELLKNHGDLVVFEKFERLHNHDSIEPSFLPVTRFVPKLLLSTVPLDSHHIELKKPFCGTTICDNPDIIKGYKANEKLREMKVLRYRLINLADDDGKNPTLTQKQIKVQDKQMNEAFSRYNITWNLNIHVVKNSTLRKKVILLNCLLRNIGDEICHKKCDLKVTGNDGGDCLPIKTCNNKLMGNGRCDRECNNVWSNFDGGDCCDERITDTSKTCFDPKSPNRAYMMPTEFKRAVNLDNRYQLNVFAVHFARDLVEGFATFPWEKSAFGVEGGTLLQADQFGRVTGLKNMVHELGHNLGLLHVHHRSDDCEDPCFETRASMELGDLCADTNPTPENDACEDPKKSQCGSIRYKNTPYRNYMGYGTQCSNEFTQDQVSRMHCYADYMYQAWRTDDTPSATPIAPKILSYSSDLLTIEWVQSLGLGTDFTRRNCNLCNWRDTTLEQFAMSAHGEYLELESGIYSAHQATGPPDAEKCEMNPYTFMPMPMDRYSTILSTSLELVFEQEVVPTGIKIWVTYNRDRVPLHLELLHVDNSITYMGPIVAQCDVPFTKMIFTKKPTRKVRIRIEDREIGIDAVQLISEKHYPHCTKCPRVQYIVDRKPPFQSRQPKTVSNNRFVDRDLQEGIIYEYRVQTVVGKHIGPLSSPVTFHTRSGFCGDGIIQYGEKEECDDGNLRDGDGCNIHCKNEDVFKCKGQPSICYKYEGDGICEDFERKISPADCGFYVPDGFSQQWAVTATGNPKHKCSHTPYDIITGPPPPDLKCYQSERRSEIKKAWFPCEESIWFEESNYWIEAGFAEPVVAVAVVVYLASDGLPIRKHTRKHFIRIKLKDEQNIYHGIGIDSVQVHCKRSPLYVPVLHDLTKPYHKTKAVRISYSVYKIAISSVALQSSSTFHPVVASSCEVTKNEYYNPKTHTCHPYDCLVPKCKPLAINNAQIACKGNNDGDTCKVTCIVGFLPAKTMMVRCVLGIWKGANIKCVPVDCGKPKIKQAVIECRKGTRYKSTCKFHCIKPARMIGNNNKIACMADGLWSIAKASCHLYCQTPQLMDNSYALDYRCDVNHMKANRENDMGTECKFQCMPGFEVKAIASNVIGIYGKVTCNEDGTWTSDSKCIPVRCKQLSEFHKLIYNCSNSNIFRSVCTTVCPHTKELHEVRCQENGKWSSSFDHCKFKGSCSPFSDDLIFDACNFNIKGSCRPVCKKKGYDVVLRGAEHLQRVNFFCMPGMKWYPSVDEVYCIESCNKDALGDGICDCKQNNKHCNYDGGDCCALTLKGTRTIRYRGNTHCKCINPIVIEALSQVASGDGDTFKRDYGDNEDDDDEDEFEKHY